MHICACRGGYDVPVAHFSDGRSRERSPLDAEQARSLSATLQGLASPSRLLILDHLRAAPCSVGELADAVAMEQPAVSQQLRVLRNLGLVTTERLGRSVVYSLHDDHVAQLIDQAIFHADHLNGSNA